MRSILFLILAALIFAGCGKSPVSGAKKSASVSATETPYDTLADSSEIVRVNGAVLTKAELDREVDFQHELWKLRNPKQSEKGWSRVRPQMLLSARDRFIARELYLGEAANAELCVPKVEDVLAVSNNLIILSGQAKLDLPGVRRLLTPESARLLDEHLKKDALVQSFLRIKAGDQLMITDKDYTEYCEGIKKLQDWSKGEYDKAMKLGNELIDRFHNGEDFGRLADEYSLARQKEGFDGPGGVWGEFMPATLLDEEVREAVKKTPVGECTRPIETPEGLFIVLVEKRTGSGENLPINLNPESLAMRRIVLRLPISYHAMTRQQFEAKALSNRFKAMQEKLLARLREKADVSYPSGSNLWVRVAK